MLAAVPIRIHGDFMLAAVVPLAAASTPAVWLVRWSDALEGWRLVAAGLIGVVVIAWLTARIVGADAYTEVEAVQTVVATLAVALVLAHEAGVIRAEAMVRPKLHAFDVAWVGALIVLGGLLVAWGEISPVFVVLGLAALMGTYPRLRHVAIRMLDRLLLADLRDRTSITAAEDERARLARDLHDTPLQELAGVIQRLELVPEAKGEGDRLRDVAHQLRTVATDLRPPVLDDLGLVAALKFLADHAPVSGPTSAVRVTVENEAGLRPRQRPPSEVELAAFRIMQEAVSNALRHSGAELVRIDGSVAPDHISLVVADDGSGMSSETGLEALQRGRLGLDSMHRRADAIGATVRTRSTIGAGTRVEFEWRR